MIMEVSTRLLTGRSEVAPPRQRGRYVVMNHVGFVAGLASGFWLVPSGTESGKTPSVTILTGPQGWVCHDFLGR
jgi:hypothetical protein